MATNNKIPGIQPGTAAKNRRFWDDPFVEPKQQHRFGILMPVYMNMGEDDTTAIASLYGGGGAGSATSNPGAVLEKTKVTPMAKDAEETLSDRDFLDREAVATPAAENSTESLGAAFKGVIPPPAGDKAAKKDVGFKVGPVNKYTNTKTTADGLGGLYLRVSEYTGFSFTPPAFTFTQGMMMRNGLQVPNQDDKQYTMGDAKLSFVVTLRDDFHWSLNFLFGVATREKAANSGGKGDLGFSLTGVQPVYLFPPEVVTDDTPKVLVVKEYSARQDAKQSKWFDAETPLEEAKALRSTPARVVGLHKFNNPVIKNVSFNQFTYGGTELVKVDISIGYAEKVQDWYSYEATTSRYQRSYFTWKDDTEESRVPAFDKARRKEYSRYPNVWSNDTNAADEDKTQISVRTAKASYGPAKERTDLIRSRMEEGDPVKINELVTKTTQVLLEEQAAAAAAARDERARREAIAASTPSFEVQAQREEEAWVARRQAGAEERRRQEQITRLYRQRTEWAQSDRTEAEEFPAGEVIEEK